MLTYLVSCCSDIPCQLFFSEYSTCQILFWLSPVSCGSEVPGPLLFWRDWLAVVLTYIDTLVLTYLVSCCSDVHWHQCFDVPGLLLFWRTLTPLFWRTWSAVVLTYIDTLFLTYLVSCCSDVHWHHVLTYLVCCCSDVISRLMEVPRLLVNWLFSSP